MLHKIITGAFFASIICSAAYAGEWIKNEHDSTSDVTLYTQQEGGRDFPSYKGEVLINASLKQVLALLMVRDTYPGWWCNMKAVRTLEKDNPQLALAYYWIKGVWPTSDRDLVVKNTVTQDAKTLEVTFRTQSVGDLVPIYPDRVRLADVASVITAAPVNSHQTKVTIEGSGDPGGTVPAWIAKRFILDTPKYTLQSLKSMLETAPEKVDLTLLEMDGFSRKNMPKIKLTD